MKTSDFAALSFDCYGTLINWEAGILAELRPWAERHKITVDDDAFLRAYGELEPACEHEMPGKLYPDILTEVHRRLAYRFGAKADEAAAKDFGGSVGRWPAFPDSAAALQDLKRRHKLAILSNVDRKSFAASNAKLGVTFDLIVTAEDVGSYKPDMRNFEQLIREMKGIGVDKGSLLHCAQSLFHDIAPAKRLGLKTLWVNRRKGKAGPGATPVSRGVRADMVVASLAELAELDRGRTP